MKNKKTLLGIGLGGFALALFGIILIRSGVVVAQFTTDYNRFVYQGIENVRESVYSIDFLGKNKMFITGGADSVFHMSNIPVVAANNGLTGGISNILGGEVNIQNSSNITVIGGKGAVEGGNNNATMFGGSENEIQGSASLNSTPTVLLGGESNIVESDHDANAIVGGSLNKVSQGAKNVNILGGTNISISGYDVVAAGQQISGNVSDSFVFNDGDYFVDVDGSGMFFLKVANGVGFGTGTETNYKGVISNGAVKLGNLDIRSVHCSSVLAPENVGLMGLWNGCMVGCTSGSAYSGQWEMLDYGDSCAMLCDSFSDCTQGEAGELTGDYTSFCTEGIVSTEHATLCHPEGLNDYKNVVFETYLIDYEDGCPGVNTVNNQCAFRCDEGYHLTGDQTGKRGGVTMCFKDCELPWDTTHSLPKKKHNEMITGYSLSGVNCSNGAGVHDTCKPYKSNLRCVDGTWYVANSGGEVTDIENTQYIYESCELRQYKCNTGVYNLTREEIVNEKYDYVPTVWRYDSLLGNAVSLLPDFFNNQNIYPGRYFFYNQINWIADASLQPELSIQNGVRGKYELCIDYNPATPNNQAPQNETLCTEATPLPKQYHYSFTGECQSGYDLAPEDSVCRKRCYYQGAVIKHGSMKALYTGANAHCPDTCHVQMFQCYDGTLYSTGDLVIENGKFITGTAQPYTIYTYPSCSLTGESCEGFIVNLGDYLSNQNIGTFTLCNRYSPSGILACTYMDTMYHLEACNENYYSNSSQTGCIECPHGVGYHYVSNTGSTQISGCSISCPGGYHVENGGGPCVPCGTGEYNPKFRASIQLCEPTYAEQTGLCTGCTNKPVVGVYEYTSYGTGINNCPWRCGKDYYLSGTNKCISCDTSKYHTDGSGATQRSQCYTVCSGGYHVATAGDDCVTCPIGYGTVQHTVSGGNTSSCSDCTNGPVNMANFQYTSYGTGGPTTCAWECVTGYYLSGGKCVSCPYGYVGSDLYRYTTTGAGATSVNQCYIDCQGGQHVLTGGKQCERCGVGTSFPAERRYVPRSGACASCTNGPTNKTTYPLNVGYYYTSYGTGISPTNCSWKCAKDYYLSGTYANGKCLPCPSGYHTQSSGATSLSQCKIECNSCSYVATQNQQCIPCPEGKTSNSHTVTGGSVSVCSNSCTKPANSSRTGNTTTSCCNWICNKDYYLNSDGTGCTKCPDNYHTAGTGSTSVTACKIECPAGTHVEVGGGQCVPCPVGSGKTQHGLFALNTSVCSGCTNKPENSHYTSNGTTPTNCNWACDTDYYRNSAGTGCEPCPSGYHTTDIGSGAINLSQCKITCDAGTHVAVVNEQCVLCPEGKDSNTHTVYGGLTSSCAISCTKPANSTYTGNTPDNRCNWVCNKNYYRNGDATGCEQCLVNVGSGYFSATGSESEHDCKIQCEAGTSVLIPRGPCEECSGGTTAQRKQIGQGIAIPCVDCDITLPDNSHYVGGGNCFWGCDKDYYKNSAKTECLGCLDNYYTDYENNIEETACKIQCNPGTYLKNARNTSCTTCPTGSGSNSHSVQQGNTSICPNCTNGPITAISTYEYTSYGIGINKCPWQCVENYYLSGTNKCVECPEGSVSPGGSTSVDDCDCINVPENGHLVNH